MLRDMLWNVVFIINERAKIIFPFPLFRRRLPQELFKKIILKTFPKTSKDVITCGLLVTAHFSRIECHLKLSLSLKNTLSRNSCSKNNSQIKFKIYEREIRYPTLGR